MKPHRMSLPFFLLGFVLVFIGMTASVSAEPTETLTIAAANSLREALRNVLPLFESRHPDINIRVVYGPSQTLRDQITQGAPVDVFLPSLFEEIEQLEKKGLIIQGTKRLYAGTTLVLITSTALPAPIGVIQDLHKTPIRRIAVGDPKTASVGKVAAQFLKSTDLEPRLKSQYVYGEHSKAVLDLVANGEAEIGVVYRTDVASNPKVRIIDQAPVGSHNPIRYGAATVWTARNISAAKNFTEFLLTPEVHAQLQKYGFDRVPSSPGLVQRWEAPQ
ncbi:molybdate ABC transporter substrate-binding protein [Nitrospira sp. Nam80]